jgi:hypothetical protein
MSCPACSRKIDDATSADRKDAKPEVGDFSLCWYCGTLLRFVAVHPLRCRIMTEQDRKDIEPEQHAKLKFIQAYILRKICK